MALLGIKIFALVDSLRYTNNQYVSAGKRSRTMWLALTGLSLAFHLITGVLSLPNIAGTIASIVYLVDVRPALQQVSGARRQPQQHGSLRALVTERRSVRRHHGRTHRLELADQSLREWDATVLDSSPEGIVLDRSAFYPGGGGQPPDHGVLLWGGVQTRIVGVRKGDDLVLLPAEGDPDPAGRAPPSAARSRTSGVRR